MASSAGATDVLAGLATYTHSTVNSLAWKVPLDAFKSKDWWGDGNAARAGLIPTRFTCVWAVNDDGTPARPSIDGPNGERHDGALTVQLIRHDTPASALERNHSGGDPKYGWRVKQSVFGTYVLAEYSVYWHHPNEKCYGNSGWVASAPEDFTSDARRKTPASGASDPKDGLFGLTPAGVTITNVGTTVNGTTTTVLVDYSDGKKTTTVIKANGDGTEQVTLTDRDGKVTSATRMSASSLGRAPEEILQGSRRINWREVVRP